LFEGAGLKEGIELLLGTGLKEDMALLLG